MPQSSRILAALFLVTACGGQPVPQDGTASNAFGVGVNEDDAELQLTQEIFEQRYYENYRSGRCGENILQFVEALHERGIDLAPFRVVSIENKGGSIFGLVKAEAARTTRWGKPAAWVRNWEHHAILVDVERKVVYDFDFLTKPTPTGLKAYIERMFLDEAACANPDESSEPCLGRDTLLDEYRWEAVPAVDALAKSDRRKKSLKMRDVVAKLR